MTTLEVASPFDRIRREDECGEYWSARDLMLLLEYRTWETFQDVIERAKAAITANGQQFPDHIRNAPKLVEIGSGAQRYIADFRLTRYGSYMIAMNGDPRKPSVASAQSYFAVSTRQNELAATSALALDFKQDTDIELVLAAGTAALAWGREQKAAKEVAEAKVAELEPAADAWEFLSAEGADFSAREAAQVLSRHPNVSIGQNQLLAHLRQIGWVDRGNSPYQSQVDNGRLVRRITDYTDQFDQRYVRVQARITTKGVQALLKRLTCDADLHSLPGGAA